MPPALSPIAQTFSRLRSQKRMAFMPFITAGDPDLATTRRALQTLAEQEVDLIEIGFPYSDPIADGPVIQASYTRALARGVRVVQILRTIAEFSRTAAQSGVSVPPLVAMVSYAIVLRHGCEAFVRQARDAGFSGLIVPDLPADEAAELSQIARGQGLDLVELIAPTTTAARTQRILETSAGFIYCVSVAGTTGVRDTLPVELTRQLQTLKSQTDLPLAVGFGISRPEQVDELRGLADGVIVGSAIVRHLAAISEEKISVDTALDRVGALAQAMVQATHKAP